MIRFKLADDQGRWAIVDNTDDAIMWMLGKTGISVEVFSKISGREKTCIDTGVSIGGFTVVPTEGKVS